MKCSDCGMKLNSQEMQNRSDYPMCFHCNYAAEMENEHSDTDGDHYGKGFVIDCPVCMIETKPIYVWVITDNPILNSLFENRKFAQFPIGMAKRILA